MYRVDVKRVFEKTANEQILRISKRFTLFRQTFLRLRGKHLSTTSSIKESTGNILWNDKEILSR